MRRKARRGGGRQVDLTISALGGQGDGVGDHQGKPVFVPFALAGERVRVRLTGEKSAGFKAELLEILDDSPDRVDAPCPHFGPCGGCRVQHLETGAYLYWKREQAVQALSRRGFADPPVGELNFVGEGTRRRASLAARRDRDGRVRLGFHGRESHAIEDIHACRIVTPALHALLPDLRGALADVIAPGEAGEVALLDSETGVDVLLQTRAPLTLTARERVAALADSSDLARVSWAPLPPREDGVEAEPVAVRRSPRLTFGDVPVEPPPGGFVQPTARGEAALIEAVSSWLGDVDGPVADFYAGCGTFTFPLARRGPVHAVEGEESAIGALWRAARKNDLAGRVTAEVRDLTEDPPDAAELEAYRAVVFDPPRVGARALAEALAASPVPAVVAVSCNANTFARDARTLVDGGYALEEVRPVDQFPWSGHLEIAALFRR